MSVPKLSAIITVKRDISLQATQSRDGRETKAPSLDFKYTYRTGQRREKAMYNNFSLIQGCRRAHKDGTGPYRQWCGGELRQATTYSRIRLEGYRG